MNDMAPNGNVVCLITSPTEQAREIAQAIVSHRLAACVNVIPLVQSIYRWEGDIEQDEESLLVVKTTRTAVEPLTTAVRELHPYENFELIALDIEAGAPAYLQWIAESVKLPK